MTPAGFHSRDRIPGRAFRRRVVRWAAVAASLWIGTGFAAAFVQGRDRRPRGALLDRLQRLSSSSSSSSIDHTDCDILCTPEASSLTEASKQTIADRLAESGLWDASSNTARSSQAIVLLAKDFVDRPEVFSSLLRTDFGFPVLEAHQTRALVMAVLKQEEEEEQNEAKEKQPQSDNEIDSDDDGNENTTGKSNRGMDMGMESAGRISNEESKGPFAADNGSSDQSIDDTANDGNAEEDTPKPKTFSDKQFRSTIVNEPAVRRKRSVDDYNYGLPKDPSNLYPKLAAELDDFYVFMTQPSTYSQESPIRAATAKVYMRHARLFLGWCCQNAGAVDNKQHDRVPNGDASIFEIVPNKNKESAENIIRFVLWLRNREISVSYEANLLRGIIKLLKFRFARESTSDPLEGKNTFDDIPIIREVRKLHRDANQRQKLAPRSSDESKKWITWQDYLGVTQSTKNEVLELIRKYEALPPSKRRYPKGDTEKLHSLEKIRVAEAYQRYLILAILASVPDRQRTIRELEVGKTLRKDSETGCWEVKHGPGDYKTGKHYGERPAMQLAEELTPAIDDFLERWRPSLKPSTNALLVQSKTGKPMTGDSVFTRVVRCCFRHTGKSVNPHLLRDIIVTHVRETEASEKELEALALYMGHSIQMQRTSYDRRTLSTKVAPAVKLMKSVNKMDGD